MCKNGADLLIGCGGSARSLSAWRQAYAFHMPFMTLRAASGILHAQMDDGQDLI
jgi:hypothetical protein